MMQNSYRCMTWGLLAALYLAGQVGAQPSGPKMLPPVTTGAADAQPIDLTRQSVRLVPEPISLPELLAIAITHRPELSERHAAIRAALVQMREAKLLPFSPQMLVGNSHLGAPLNLGSFDTREDLDVVMYWSLRNLGVGNIALIRVSQSQYQKSELQALATLDRVRAEVTSAQAKVLARYAQIESNEKAIQSSNADVEQSRAKEIVDYNRAQFELYVALGQPPLDTLARPVTMRLGAPEAASQKK